MGTRQTSSNENSTSPSQTQNPQKSANLENVYGEITKMSTTLQMVATDILTIKQTTAELKTTVNAIQERVEEAKGADFSLGRHIQTASDQR